MADVAAVAPASRPRLGIAGLVLAGGAIALALTFVNLARILPPEAWSTLIRPGDGMAALVARESFLPRLVVSLASGAALGLAGTLFQQILRNPLASETTLGVSAGAQAALALAMLFAPGLVAFSRETVAWTGSGTALALVLALAAGRRLSPLSVVLAGLVVTLTLGALGASLVVLAHDYLTGLYVWGGGSLSQQDWTAASALSLRFALGAIGAALLVRPLMLMDLDETAARALGQRTGLTRFLGLGLGVALAGSVVAHVGVIGFIGLAAGNLARLAGARRLSERLVGGPLIGAVLLWLTDQGVQQFAGVFAEMVPTGAATALIGAPLMLWLIPRVRSAPDAVTEPPPLRAARTARPGTVLVGLGLAVVAALMLAVFAGATPERFVLLDWATAERLLPLKGPRIAGALAAGVLLGVAGTLLQRLTRNPMASPEVLGIGAGATFALMVLIVAVPGASPAARLVAAGAGSLGLAMAVLGLTSRAGFAPARLVLSGIAIGGFFDAFVVALMVTGDPNAQLLLDWTVGSTWGIGWTAAGPALAAAAVVPALAAPAVRALDILPLGDAAATGLGLPLARVRLALFALAAVATAAATVVVGPLTFAGLMAPHLARLMGFRRASGQLAAAMLAGAAILTLADTAGRLALYPWELPLGLVATLAGGPLMMLLMRRDR